MAISTIIDASPASSSPFQRTSKIVPNHTGIRVHDELETLTAVSRNMQ
jgi:hypothetical protein